MRYDLSALLLISTAGLRPTNAKQQLPAFHAAKLNPNKHENFSLLNFWKAKNFPAEGAKKHSITKQKQTKNESNNTRRLPQCTSHDGSCCSISNGRILPTIKKRIHSQTKTLFR